LRKRQREHFSGTEHSFRTNPKGGDKPTRLGRVRATVDGKGKREKNVVSTRGREDLVKEKKSAIHVLEKGEGLRTGQTPRSAKWPRREKRKKCLWKGRGEGWSLSGGETSKGASWEKDQEQKERPTLADTKCNNRKRREEREKR